MVSRGGRRRRDRPRRGARLDRWRWASTRDRGRRLAVVGWLFVATAVAVVASARRGIVLFPSMVALQAGLPLLGPPLVVVAGWAGWRRRRRLLGAAAVAVVVLAWTVAPTVRSAAPPGWAAASPRLRVVAANLFRGNPRPDDAFAAIDRLDGDVVVLVEVTDALARRLDRTALARTHPYRVRRGGDVVLSRVPVVGTSGTGDCELDAPSLRVRVGGRAVEVVASHTASPADWSRRERWSRELAAVERLVAQRRGASVVLAGDFNANRYHAPFATLLRMGAQDAHDTLGEGWRPSWGPRQLPLLASIGVFRLDHALSMGDVAPVAVTDAVVPGSDHRALAVTYAVRPVVTGSQEARRAS